MKYFCILLLLIFTCSISFSQDSISESEFVEDIRLAVYHQDYYKLKKYYDDTECRKGIPWSQNGIYVQSLSILVNALDT